MFAALILLSAASLAAWPPPPAASPACFWTSPTNLRLPVGRLRDLPPGVACAAPIVTAAPPPPSAAPVEVPVNVIVLHELRVRPSAVIWEPPEVHFVDAPPVVEPAQETPPPGPPAP